MEDFSSHYEMHPVSEDVGVTLLKTGSASAPSQVREATHQEDLLPSSESSR
jgi:hypothetical protein